MRILHLNSNDKKKYQLPLSHKINITYNVLFSYLRLVLIIIKKQSLILTNLTMVEFIITPLFCKHLK